METQNLLDQPFFQAKKDAGYELFGFVYKIKAFGINKKGIDLKKLKKVELMCKDRSESPNESPKSLDSSEKTISKGKSLPRKIPKITVLHLPEISSKLDSLLLGEWGDRRQKKLSDSFCNLLSHVSMKSSLYESVKLMFND